MPRYSIIKYLHALGNLLLFLVSFSSTVRPTACPLRRRSCCDKVVSNRKPRGWAPNYPSSAMATRDQLSPLSNLRDGSPSSFFSVKRVPPGLLSKCNAIPHLLPPPSLRRGCGTPAGLPLMLSGLLLLLLLLLGSLLLMLLLLLRLLLLLLLRLLMLLLLMCHRQSLLMLLSNHLGLLSLLSSQKLGILVRTCRRRWRGDAVH